MTKVLVTGYSGFLGTHLVPKLEEIGMKVYTSNTKHFNLNNSADELHYQTPIALKFDYIFHLAAVTKAGDYCLHHKGDQWISNQTINTNILSYWKRYQPQAKMIAMGTSCSYSPDLPMEEKNYMLGQPDKGLYTYAMTKRMLLNGLQSIEEQYGLKWLYFVPSTLFGPEFDLRDNHFIFDLIRKIYNGKMHGDKVELWGDGFQKRELIDVRDAVSIMLSLLEIDNQVFNLCRGKEYTIRHYAEVLCELIGFEAEKISYDTTKYVGVRSKRLIPDKVLPLLPAFTFSSLENSLRETTNYYIKNIEEKNE